MKSWQPVYFHERWGHCAKCGHAAKYRVQQWPLKKILEGKLPKRGILPLEYTPCERCATLLGRGSNRRARDLFKRLKRRQRTKERVQPMVDGLVRQMGLGWSTVRTPSRAAVPETPAETSAGPVARRSARRTTP